MRKIVLAALVVAILLVGAGAGWWGYRQLLRDPLAAARELQATGDLRGALLELRNAVRARPDSGEAHFRTPSSLAGTHGSFTFNAATGAWGYTLDQAKADPLGAGTVVHDTLTVTSHDGTASRTIDVTINGTNDSAVIGSATAVNVTEDAAAPTLTGIARDFLPRSVPLALRRIEQSDDELFLRYRILR